MDGTSDSDDARAEDVAKGEAKEASTTTTPATGAATSALSPVDVVRGWVEIGCGRLAPDRAPSHPPDLWPLAGRPPGWPPDTPLPVDRPTGRPPDISPLIGCPPCTTSLFGRPPDIPLRFGPGWTARLALDPSTHPVGKFIFKMF